MYQMMENEKECEEHKMVEKTMDKIVALAKSRGFVYPVDLRIHGIMVISV